MSRPARIALVGFMGAGKSAVGRVVASHLGYRFKDSDAEIEARAHATVPEIFQERGEPWFRDLELAVTRDLLKEPQCVIATGGGAFAQPTCAAELLAHAFTVYLSCDFAESQRRVAAATNRPLMKRGTAALARLYAERKDKYARAHAIVDTTRLSVDEAALDVVRLLAAS